MVGQDFNHPPAQHADVVPPAGLEDFENQFVLLQSADFLEAEASGDALQFGHGLALEFPQFHDLRARRCVTVLCTRGAGLIHRGAGFRQ